MKSRKWMLWGIAVAAATGLTLFGTIQEYTWRRVEGVPFVLGRMVREQALNWYSWAFVAPVVISLSARMFGPSSSRGRRVAMWLGLGIGATIAHTAIEVLAARALHHVPTTMTVVTMMTARYWATLPLNAMVFGLVAVVDYALTQQWAARERERREGGLRTELAEARLEALRRQLHPHFLFNTLHSVTALMAENVEGARRVLARLGDLLRMSFAYADANEVPVADELLFLDHYLEIQRVRFQSRLIVDVQVDPAAREALVPSLVLQPLVENAIRHAIEPRLRPGTIRVVVSREGPWVRLEVSDDGPGLPSMGAAKGVGIGLANTRERLEKLYGDQHRFELTNGAVAGLTVLIEVPFRGPAA